VSFAGRTDRLPSAFPFAQALGFFAAGEVALVFELFAFPAHLRLAAMWTCFFMISLLLGRVQYTSLFMKTRAKKGSPSICWTSQSV